MTAASYVIQLQVTECRSAVVMKGSFYIDSLIIIKDVICLPHLLASI